MRVCHQRQRWRRAYAASSLEAPPRGPRRFLRSPKSAPSAAWMMRMSSVGLELVVAHGCAPRAKSQTHGRRPAGGGPNWPLPGPVQLVPQDVPHVPWVVGHAGHPLDHLRHTWQRPQVAEVPVGFGSVGQHRFDLSELSVAQLWPPSSSTRCTQRITATLSPHPAPVRDDLMRDAQLTRDLRWTDIPLEQLRGTHAALFHRLEVTPTTHSPDARACRALLLAGNSWRSGHGLSFAPSPTSPVVPKI